MASIEWLGHATFRIKNGVTIYIDPTRLDLEADKADLILISHGHFDHFGVEEIERLRQPSTVIICSSDCTEHLSGDVRPASPGDESEVHGVTIKAVPAYNTERHYHPRKRNWLGFVIEVGGERIYYAGDTDAVPEMESLGRIDTALLPIGGTYTMNAEEAAEAAKQIKPGRCIPYHFGELVGKVADAGEFERLCQCPTEIQSPD